MKPVLNFRNSSSSAVYRGLVVSPVQRLDEVVSIPNKNVAVKSNSFPIYPFVPPPMSTTVIYQSHRVEDIQQRLVDYGCNARLYQSEHETRLNCSMEAKDGNESVEFTVNFWTTLDLHPFVVFSRSQGCAFYFHLMVKKALGECTKECKLFRVPALPACFALCKELHPECMERSIQTCLHSPCMNQRIQELRVLANLVEENSQLWQLFCELDGGNRLKQGMEKETDANLMRALSRLLSHV